MPLNICQCFLSGGWCVFMFSGFFLKSKCSLYTLGLSVISIFVHICSSAEHNLCFQIAQKKTISEPFTIYSLVACEAMKFVL